MKLIARAPGKLILLGEYAVLESAPALVAAVDRFARIIFEKTGETNFTVEASVIDIPQTRFILDAKGKVKFLKNPLNRTVRKLRFFITILEYAVRILKQQGIFLAPAKITLDTSEFFLRKGAAKLGLGSSAALTVALLAGLIEYSDHSWQNTIDPDYLFRLAMQAHRSAQGNIGSGIDIAACVYGGVLVYRIPILSNTNDVEIKPTTMANRLKCLPIWSGKASSTSEFVKRFYLFKQNNRMEYTKIMEELAELSSLGNQVFLDNNIREFLTIAKSYYRKMADLGDKIDITIISPEHQKIAEIAHEIGAVYKPSGAGGGDLGIAFSESTQILDAVKNEIEKSGYEIVHLNFGTEGIQIQNNKVVLNEKFAHS